MSKWIFRLTGLLVVVLVALLFLDRWLNPDVPDYIQNGIDVTTQGDNKSTQPTSPGATPEVPELTLTSIDDNSDSAGQSAPPASESNNQTQSNTSSEPALTLTALEEEESMPVLSNPDSQLANVWLQAGSFGERANAEKRAAVLKAHSWRVEIDPVVIEGKNFYRVYVGPLAHDQVSGYLSKLNDMKINAREVTR